MAVNLTPLGPITNNLDLANLLGPDSDAGPPGSPDPGSEEDPLSDDSDEGPGSGPDNADTDDSAPPSGPNDDDPPPPTDSDDDKVHITLEKMKINTQFIEMVRESTLESQFTPAELRAFKNPQEIQSSPLDDPDLHLSLRFYISSLNHNLSQKDYAGALLDIQEHYPESKMLSYDQVKQQVSDLSGVVTWKHDMCFKSYVAFTGPFANLEVCPDPRCWEPRYDQHKLTKSNGKVKVPQKVFTMFALGPQLQAEWKNPQAAEGMLYRWCKTQEELARDKNADDYVYNNIFCAEAYLKAIRKGKIKDEDMVVMLSIDGAQLFRNKKSDCWVYIWIILDLAPNKHYKVRNILPRGVIPGPGHPKNLDFFLFPGLAHVSAVQREGLRLYDSYHCKVVTSQVFVLLALADCIGMAELSGSVGHHGRRGCRLLCEFEGCNKLGGPHYYPVLLQPLGTHPQCILQSPRRRYHEAAPSRSLKILRCSQDCHDFPDRHPIPAASPPDWNQKGQYLQLPSPHP